tara:strand:+ start:63 stop:602 length:540 start_codon:yes stop_codon:yes gene_type:complete
MKKVLLALLVSLGLQLQAQSSCDSTMSYTTGSQFQLEIAFGIGGNTPSTWSAPIYVWTYYEYLNVNAVILGEDSCFGQPCTHMVYNYNTLTGMPYDTLTTCVTYVTSDSIGNIDTLMCCFDQYWNGQAWARVMNITVGIEEYTINQIVDNKIYDMLGRELKEIPVGKLYIRNKQLYINK